MGSSVKPEPQEKPTTAEERLQQVADRARAQVGIIGAAADYYRNSKRSSASTNLVVADLNSYALALSKLADFAETGE